jgi:uncharacterized protein YbjQ (UPF0145 family)
MSWFGGLFGRPEARIQAAVPISTPRRSAFAVSGDHSRPLIRFGSVRQTLSQLRGGTEPDILPRGTAHAETWLTAGSDWAGVHEQGWRLATERLRQSAALQGAHAVLNLRYRLERRGAALGFLLHGEVVRVRRLDGVGVIPCVPLGHAAFGMMLDSGMVPIGFSVGTWDEGFDFGWFSGLSSDVFAGEDETLTRARRNARDNALSRLYTDPICGAWDGALAHDEVVSLQIGRQNGTTRTLRLRAAVSLLGFRRIPASALPSPQFTITLDDAVCLRTVERPRFFGIEDGLEIDDQESEPEVETAFDLAREADGGADAGFPGGAPDFSADPGTAGTIFDAFGSFGDDS